MTFDPQARKLEADAAKARDVLDLSKLAPAATSSEQIYGLRFGRRRPDPMRLTAFGARTLEDYLALSKVGALPTPPVTVPTPQFCGWGMDGNDAYSNCAEAMFDHGCKASAVLTGETSQPWATAQEIVAWYLAMNNGQDIGTDLYTMFGRITSIGFPGNQGQQRFAALGTPWPELQLAMYLADWAALGIVVYEGMMTAYKAGNTVWDISTISGGIIGSHAVPLIGYDTTPGINHAYCVTWGTVQAIDIGILPILLEEAWVSVVDELVAALGNGRGTGLTALDADLSTLPS
jgi:hypothetical protein